jgi:hypothetical protein
VCFLQVLFMLPTDDPFPNLRELHGWIEPTLLRFLHRFVSPRLSVFSVYLHTDDRLGCSGYGSLTDAISVIPGPSLRRFSLGDHRPSRHDCVSSPPIPHAGLSDCAPVASIPQRPSLALPSRHSPSGNLPLPNSNRNSLHPE